MESARQRAYDLVNKMKKTLKTRVVEVKKKDFDGCVFGTDIVGFLMKQDGIEDSFDAVDAAKLMIYERFIYAVPEPDKVFENNHSVYRFCDVINVNLVKFLKKMRNDMEPQVKDHSVRLKKYRKTVLKKDIVAYLQGQDLIRVTQKLFGYPLGAKDPDTPTRIGELLVQSGLLLNAVDILKPYGSGSLFKFLDDWAPQRELGPYSMYLKEMAPASSHSITVEEPPPPTIESAAKPEKEAKMQIYEV